MSEDTMLLAEDILDFVNAVEAACVRLRMQIDKNLGPDTSTPVLPGSEDFSTLPWKSYTTKRDAEPDEAGWIFANAKGAEALLATLKSRNGKARIGAFDYQIQGPEHQFIARKPLKE